MAGGDLPDIIIADQTFIDPMIKGRQAVILDDLLPVRWLCQNHEGQ